MKLRGYQIALIASIAIFAVGIVLSILFNTLFLFFIIPFGFAWGFRRRGQPQQTPQQSSDSFKNSSTGNQLGFCSYCGSPLGEKDLTCPVCGKPVFRRMNYDDLR